MKKTNAIMTSAVLLCLLTGCKDASADLNDKDTVLFKVGETTVTKGTVYDMLMNSAASDTIMNSVQKKIAAKEIEITDDIKKDAQETLDMYVEYYGDSFTSYLEQLGMTTEDYLNESLIPSIQVEQLSEKYVNENFASLAETYKPVKAILIDFTEQADADAALEELKNGSDPADVASTHNSSSSGTAMVYTTESSSVDSLVRTTMLNGMTADDGWTMIPASDGSSFSIVKIEETDPEKFHDDAVSTLRTLADVSTASTRYWLEKYSFHVYDITAYNAIKNEHPEYLIQDGSPETEETEETTETTEPTE